MSSLLRYNLHTIKYNWMKFNKRSLGTTTSLDKIVSSLQKLPSGPVLPISLIPGTLKVMVAHWTVSSKVQSLELSPGTTKTSHLTHQTQNTTEKSTVIKQFSVWRMPVFTLQHNYWEHLNGLFHNCWAFSLSWLNPTPMRLKQSSSFRGVSSK